MLATLIKNTIKNHFIFIQLKNERLTVKLVRCTFHDCINTIYQLTKPFLDNKMSIFEEYGAFNHALSL